MRITRLDPGDGGLYAAVVRCRILQADALVRFRSDTDRLAAGSDKLFQRFGRFGPDTLNIHQQDRLVGARAVAQFAVTRPAFGKDFFADVVAAVSVLVHRFPHRIGVRGVGELRERIALRTEFRPHIFDRRQDRHVGLLFAVLQHGREARLVVHPVA